VSSGVKTFCTAGSFADKGSTTPSERLTLPTWLASEAKSLVV